MLKDRAIFLVAAALLLSIAAFASRFDARDSGSRPDRDARAADRPADASPAAAQGNPVASANTPYFQEVVGAMPDFKPLYDLFGKPTFVRTVPMDVNSDGLDDLVLHFWALNLGGPANNDPCVNRLVVLIHKPGGTFVDETATRIAGPADIQACSSDHAVLDVNADGRPDLVFAASQEDQRSWTDPAQIHTLNAALVSRPDGKYGVERFGIQAWHFGISLPRVDNGETLVAISSFTTSAEVFRRSASGVWENANAGLPALQAVFSQFYRPDGGTGPSTRLIKNAVAPSNFDLGGAMRDASGVWQELPELRFFEYPGMVLLHGGSATLTLTPVVRVGDEYAATGSFHRGCEFRFSPGAPVTVMTRLQMSLMPVPYTGPDQIVYVQDLIPVSMLRAFNIVDGALAVVPLNLAGEKIRGVNANTHACLDVNADGYDDVVVYGYGPHPDVYVNNQKGGLRYIGPVAFPTQPVFWGGRGDSLLHDFDHDGLVDYFSCPCNATSSQTDSVNFHFHKGIAALPSTSVPADPRGAVARGVVGAAVVGFSAPLDDGGLPITGYIVQSIPAGGVDTQAGSLAMEHLVTGLTNGTSYKFVAVANNAKGASNPSLQSNAVTPLPHLISVAGASIVEGDGGTSLLDFTVTLSTPAPHQISVGMSTSNGSATAGSDYDELSIPATIIPAGQTSAHMMVTVNGDLEVESSETVTVSLSNPVGANVGIAQAVGRIVNDDLPMLSLADASIEEGNTGQQTMRFRLTLARWVDAPVRFDIATTSGTATGGSDFVSRSLSNVVIDAGRTSTVFEVAIMGDQSAEPNEQFSVLLSNIQGAIAGDVSAIGTIQNDDGSPARLTGSAGRATAAGPGRGRD